MKPTGLRGKVVIVTGGGAGIGRATARCFAAEGCCVAAWDVSDVAQSEVLQELHGGGADALFRKTDVSVAEDVQVGVKEVIARWGRIDVLVNNAGIVRDRQLVNMEDDAFESVVSVNLKGTFLCTRAVASHMIQAASGVILNASSIVASYGNFGQTNYAASKAGVTAFVRTWSRELGKYNIRVNAVAPGFVATDMVRKRPQKVIQAMISQTPLNRIGAPEDIAEAYVWLASDAASFITGAVLPVDGGLVLGT